MPVITELCVGTCDTACVHVCPVDCIHGPIPLREIEAVPKAERAMRFPVVQLFIDPNTCISCGACEPECPVQAIFEEDEVPNRFLGAIERNAAFFRAI